METKTLTWQSRHLATNPQEAMQALADGARHHAYAIVRGGAESAYSVAGALYEYASAHGIPVDRKALEAIACETLGYEPDPDENFGWNASYC